MKCSCCRIESPAKYLEHVRLGISPAGIEQQADQKPLRLCCECLQLPLDTVSMWCGVPGKRHRVVWEFFPECGGFVLIRWNRAEAEYGEILSAGPTFDPDESDIRRDLCERAVEQFAFDCDGNPNRPLEAYVLNVTEAEERREVKRADCMWSWARAFQPRNAAPDDVHLIDRVTQSVIRQGRVENIGPELFATIRAKIVFNLPDIRLAISTAADWLQQYET